MTDDQEVLYIDCEDSDRCQDCGILVLHADEMSDDQAEISCSRCREIHDDENMSEYLASETFPDRWDEWEDARTGERGQLVICRAAFTVDERVL